MTHKASLIKPQAFGIYNEILNREVPNAKHQI